MKREQLDWLIGKYVIVELVDGHTIRGLLEYTPEFSAKYGWKKPGYYSIRNYAFKASHVRKAVKE